MPEVALRGRTVLGPLGLAAYTPTAAHEAEVAAEGLAFRSRRPGDRRSPLFETLRLDAVVVPWSELARLEGAEPWPLLRLVSSARGARYEEVFGPSSRAIDDVRAFEATALRLLAAARRAAPHAVIDGWSAVEHAPWSAVERLPASEAAPPPRSAAAFRANARPSTDDDPFVVAHRTHAPTFGWLAELLDRAIRSHNGLIPAEALVTADGELYVRWRDGRCGCLPVSAVRARTTIWSDREGKVVDVVYTLGRATYLALPDARSCPVAAALDAALGDGPASEGAPTGGTSKVSATTRDAGREGGRER